MKSCAPWYYLASRLPNARWKPRHETGVQFEPLLMAYQGAPMQ
jgi:hypothetical protein